MEISQHIKNLLITNERVILGGFGAFDSKHIPAHIDKETKTMTPPYKVVIFNPEYTEDEGLLAKHFAEKEEISFENAKEQISEYVKTIKSKLDSGAKVLFRDLGEFNKDNEGNYQFSYLSEDNLLVDSFGLPKVSLTEQEQSKQVKKVPPKNTRREPLKRTPVKNVKPPISKKPKPIPKEKPKSLKKQKPVKLKKETVKKKKTWPVLLIILGLIGVLLVALWFFKPDLWKKGYDFSSEKIAFVKEKVFGGNKEKLEIITPDEDNNQTEKAADNYGDTAKNVVEVTEDSTSTEEIADNNVNENNQDSDIQDNSSQDAVEDNTQAAEINSSTNSAHSGKYYIIISSVKSETSAQREQKRFAAKGITTNIIYVPNPDRFRISIGEFSSAKEAQNFFSDFENQHGKTDAWVWEKR